MFSSAMSFVQGPMSLNISKDVCLMVNEGHWMGWVRVWLAVFLVTSFWCVCVQGQERRFCRGPRRRSWLHHGDDSPAATCRRRRELLFRIWSQCVQHGRGLLVRAADVIGFVCAVTDFMVCIEMFSNLWIVCFHLRTSRDRPDSHGPHSPSFSKKCPNKIAWYENSHFFSRCYLVLWPIIGVVW